MTFSYVSEVQPLLFALYDEACRCVYALGSGNVAMALVPLAVGTAWAGGWLARLGKGQL